MTRHGHAVRKTLNERAAAMPSRAGIGLALCCGFRRHVSPLGVLQGNRLDAIRASCAFPGLFEPVEIGTRCLAAGWLVAPVPTHAARDLGAATVIGVSVGLQDGYRGAPTNIFQVVSRAVNAAEKHQLEIWERYADLVLRPDVQTLPWDDFHSA